MSRQLLNHLNGNNTGNLKKFLNGFKGEPRIAWYPSAGEDFKALLYLHPNYSQLNPADRQEPAPPDLFLFTDYYPWQDSTFLDNNVIFSSNKTRVIIESIEALPNLNLPLHVGIVDFPEGSTATDKAIFLQIRVESDTLGIINYPVIYAFAENEAFYCQKLVPKKATISHIIHVRYGGGLGGGGKSNGVWLLNVLNTLSCEMFITDGRHQWQSGDTLAMDYCASIPRENTSVLTPIRTIESEHWSGYGDVSWNLVK